MGVEIEVVKPGDGVYVYNDIYHFISLRLHSFCPISCLLLPWPNLFPIFEYRKGGAKINVNSRESFARFRYQSMHG